MFTPDETHRLQEFVRSDTYPLLLKFAEGLTGDMLGALKRDRDLTQLDRIAGVETLMNSLSQLAIERAAPTDE